MWKNAAENDDLFYCTSRQENSRRPSLNFLAATSIRQYSLSAQLKSIKVGDTLEVCSVKLESHPMSPGRTKETTPLPRENGQEIS